MFSTYVYIVAKQYAKQYVGNRVLTWEKEGAPYTSLIYPHTIPR